MTCEECLPALDDLVEGELAEAEALRVMLHLGGCAPCARELDLLERERQVLREYARAAAPSPRLGAAFREALAREPRRPASIVAGRLRGLLGGFAPRRPRLALTLVAAAMLFAAGAPTMLRHESWPEARPVGGEQAAGVPEQRDAPPDSVSTVPGRQPSPPGHGEAVEPPRRAGGKSHSARRAVARTSPSGPEAARAMPVVATAERRYREAVTVLARELHRRRARFDAGELARLEADLGELDRVIASSRSAVRKDPADAEAVRYMADAYLAKITLMRRVTSD